MVFLNVLVSGSLLLVPSLGLFLVFIYFVQFQCVNFCFVILYYIILYYIILYYIILYYIIVLEACSFSNERQKEIGFGAGEMAQWVRAPDCSSEGPEFKSQQPHGGSQPSLMKSDALFWSV
jgi:hypothetical protein